MVKYDDVKNQTTEEYFNSNQFSIDAFKKKYALTDDETYVQALKRVCDFIASVEKTPELRKHWSERWFDEIYNDWFHPAGSIMQGAGSGRKVSLANCFSRDTKFITDKGAKSFENFNDGDIVNVLTNYGGFKPAKIKSFGKQRLYNITVMRNGIYKDIKSTIDHVWRTIEGETIVLKKTSELLVGNNLPYIKRKSMGDGADAQKRYFCPIGFIHGQVFGDGYYNKDGNYCSLDLCGDSKQFIKFFQGFDWKTNEQKDRIRILYLPNYMKQLPDFDKVNSEYILGFIVGWFSADGTVDSSGRAALYNNNLETLIKIKDVLESIGIYCSEIQTKRETNDVEIQGKKYHSEKGYNLYSLYFVKDTLFETFFVKESHKKNYAEYISSLQKDKSRVQWKVISIDETDLYEDVWCVEEPETQNFTLSGGINTHNCTTISLGYMREDEEWDSLEAIYKNAAYTVAKCAAYRQGLGIDFSRLRPKGSSILNSANISDGSIHWMHFIDSIGYTVGQKGRIPAMLFSLSINHPDIQDFITVKSDYTKIQNANISVQITDAFYKCVEADGEWEMSFSIPHQKKGQKIYVDIHSTDMDCKKDDAGWYYLAKTEKKSETITKTIKARKLLELIAKNMYVNAEPGIQNIDLARKYSNSDAVYDENDEYDSRILSTNACCVVGNTKILTNIGCMEISNIYDLIKSGVAKDLLIMSYDIKSKTYKFEKVLNAFQQRNDYTVTLTIKENDEIHTIECSSDHKIYTKNRGFVEASALTEYDDIQIFS